MPQILLYWIFQYFLKHFKIFVWTAIKTNKSVRVGVRNLFVLPFRRSYAKAEAVNVFCIPLRNKVRLQIFTFRLSTQKQSILLNTVYVKYFKNCINTSCITRPMPIKINLQRIAFAFFRTELICFIGPVRFETD